MSSIPILKERKKLFIIIAGFVIGIGLLMLGSFDTGKKETKENAIEDVSEMYYSEILEKKLENFLKNVDGIDSVKVFITVDGGKETKYAEIWNTNETASDYLVIDKGKEESAAVVREVYPAIRGVAVACSGGEDADVKNEITNLISAALGVSTNKIMVAGYK